MLNMSFTDVDKEVEQIAKNTHICNIFEYEELTTKLMEKGNKEVGDDNEKVVKKQTLYGSVKTIMTKLKMTRGCENCCCFSHCILNEQGMTVRALTVYVDLCKESLFSNLLDGTRDKFEEYKAELLDKVLMVQFLPYAIHTNQDEDVKKDSCSASVNAHVSI